MMDLILNDDFDLRFDSGDLFVADSTQQNQELLLLVAKGEVREYPDRGVGIRTWILDDLDGDLNGAIKREFESDGMTVNTIRRNAGNLVIDATYE